MESVSIRVICGLKCNDCDEICVYLRYLRFLRAMVRWCDDSIKRWIRDRFVSLCFRGCGVAME